jgi:hypothetical protein
MATNQPTEFPFDSRNDRWLTQFILFLTATITSVSHKSERLKAKKAFDSDIKYFDDFLIS